MRGGFRDQETLCPRRKSSLGGTLDKITIVVGDRFATEECRDEVLGVSRFLAELRAGDHDARGDCQIIVGQGVGTADEDRIRAEIARRGLADRFTMRQRAPEPLPGALVHKRHQENVLLADLRRTAEDRFAARLTVGDTSELVLDHVSGWHISGMVINEAARQMILAVTETFYAQDHPRAGYRYLLESWQTSFERFLFPLDATVHYTVDRFHRRRPDRLRFEVNVAVTQGDQRAASCRIAFTAMDAEVFRTIERRKADEVLGELLDKAPAAPAATAVGSR